MGYMNFTPFVRGRMAGLALGKRLVKQEKKLCAIRARQLGLAPREIAHIVGVEPLTVYKWSKEVGDNYDTKRDERQRIRWPINGKNGKRGYEWTYTKRKWLTKRELELTGRKRKALPRERMP